MMRKVAQHWVLAAALTGKQFPPPGFEPDACFGDFRFVFFLFSGLGLWNKGGLERHVGEDLSRGVSGEAFWGRCVSLLMN